MTTQTQESQDQEVSTKAVPWDVLTQIERIRVRKEMQQVCKSGGRNRNDVALRIAEVLDSSGKLHSYRLAVAAWECNVHHAPRVWGKNSHAEDRPTCGAEIAQIEKIACDIVDWLLATKFLLDNGSDGIVICAEFPDKPADQSSHIHKAMP